MFSRPSRTRRRTRFVRQVLVTCAAIAALPIGLELALSAIVRYTSVGANLLGPQEADTATKPTDKEAYRLVAIDPIDGNPLAAQASKVSTSALSSPESVNIPPSAGETAQTGEQPTSARLGLQVQHHPLLGYELTPNQANRFWSINDRGFRDSEPVSKKADDNEIRVVILGGSTAFGLMAPNNETTLAHQLEGMLNERVTQQQGSPEQFQPVSANQSLSSNQVRSSHQAPDVDANTARIRNGNYRVINAAVPGYTSGNELALFVHRIAALEPDITIVLNGYADLVLPSNQAGVATPGIDALMQSRGRDSDVSFKTQIKQQVARWSSQLLIVRGFERYILVDPVASSPGTASSPDIARANTQEPPVVPFPDTLVANATEPVETLPWSETELDERVERYNHNLRQLAQLHTGTNRHVIIGLQPELSGRTIDTRTSVEQALLNELDSDYTLWIEKGYTQLEQISQDISTTSPNVTAVNWRHAANSSPGSAFRGPTVLTTAGQSALVQHMFDLVVTKLAVKS